MSEEKWLRAMDARTLWELLPNNDERKLRHFVLACARNQLVAPLGSEDAALLAFAERVADGDELVSFDRSQEIYQELCDRWGEWAGGQAGWLSLTIGNNVGEEVHFVLELLREARAEPRVTLAVFRDIFGNPFRPIDFAPWRTNTATALARGMYESRDFSAMPILADALQDAGCDNDDVLAHCRDAGATHVRGCWVVDGVLAKE